MIFWGPKSNFFFRKVLLIIRADFWDPAINISEPDLCHCSARPHHRGPRGRPAHRCAVRGEVLADHHLLLAKLGAQRHQGKSSGRARLQRGSGTLWVWDWSGAGQGKEPGKN